MTETQSREIADSILLIFDTYESLEQWADEDYNALRDEVSDAIRAEVSK